ncbi:MAG: ATP-binding protein [Desulfobacterium sp.]|nr:ATP-binding protein [Desulfobacterium sp.]
MSNRNRIMAVSMRLGLSRKIYLGFFSLLLVQGLVIFFWVSHGMKQPMIEEIRNRGLLIGKNLAARMVEPILAMDFLKMKVLVDETILLNDDIGYTFVLDKDDVPLAHTFKDGFSLELRRANTVSDDQKESVKLLDTGQNLIYDYEIPIVINDNQLGTLRLGLFRTQAQKTGYKIVVSVLVTSVTMIIIAALVGFLLHRPATNSTQGLVKEQKILLQTILDAIPDFISFQDHEGRYVSVNRAFCKMLGKGVDDIVGKKNHDLFSRFHADLYDREDRKVLESRVPLVKENRLRGPKGIKWLHVVKIPVLELTNKINGLVCSGRDISQLKKVQDQLAHAQKMESVGRLAAGVAHEINTPLGIILGYAQLLQEDIEKDGQIYKDVSIIVKQTKICSKIISDLLKFSRSSENIISEFDVNGAMEEVLDVVEHTFSLNHVVVQREYESDCLMMTGDKEKIKQVFLNLLNNAFDAIEENGTIYIKTSRGNGESQIKVAIVDTGHGIKKDDLKMVFEPFYTTKGPDKGTGLGLSVTFGIIKEHNGSVNVFSPPISREDQEHGTEFVVVLPKCSPPAQFEV